jgi:hypothetical protein
LAGRLVMLGSGLVMLDVCLAMLDSRLMMLDGRVACCPQLACSMSAATTLSFLSSAVS